MEASEQIELFQEFFEQTYLEPLSEQLRKGESHLVVNFSDLSKFNPELAEQLLETPEDTLKAAEIAIERFDIEGSKKNFRVRFFNLPPSQFVFVRDIRSKHINKLVQLQGLVRQKSDVRPQVTSAKFECPSCGNLINVLQLDTQFKEPSQCSCGRRGKFRQVNKELVDAQKIVLEEAPEDLEGSEQPKRISIFLKNDLVSPLSEKRTNPGTKIIVTGIIKETPVINPGGLKSVRYDLSVDANHLQPVQEDFLEIEIAPEEKKQILELSKDPEVFEKLVRSIAPSVYGHERVKEALVLQLFGGVKKVRDKGDITRGDTHILLLGDPGCIAGDSRVALLYKGMKPIHTLGQKHLQPIKEAVMKIRKHPKDKEYDFATTFHFYEKQPVLKVVTETGKEVVCTYNQPFLTKSGWVRADELAVDEEIRVMPKIPNKIKNLIPTGFERIESKSGRLKRVSLPDKFTPELATLCGYIVGDGTVHSDGYSVTCFVNNEEKDLIAQLSNLWKATFNVDPYVYDKNKGGHEKVFDDGNGQLRYCLALQPMYGLEINSKQIAHSLSFLANKRVPQQVFESPKEVVAKFLSWLFEADGCTFSKGRGRTAIQLKSTSKGLLREVQLLLLYFGIHSRINEDNLCIRRSHDIELFEKHIGFNSAKKKKSLQLVLEEIKQKSGTQKRKKYQRYEKIKNISPAGISDVYDFEVPKSHSFIANGIICHNSGKSVLLRKISSIAPKARYISGKGASGAGLTATVVKDEFMRGWALEAGAMVLANKGLCAIDELDKMSDEDRSAMHESLEQQTVTITKANIHATLRAEATVLAAANPKFGRFDPYELLAKQIDLPSTLINRFDLIFPVRDLPDAKKDEKMADFVLHLHQGDKSQEGELKPEFIKKYIAYAKQNVKPKLTESAMTEIKEFYVQMRNKLGEDHEGIKAIPISARQLEALVRLSEAGARMRLSEKVTKKDARRAIDLVHYCLSQIGLDPETGKIDIDRITTGITASQRSHIAVVRDIINELEKTLGKMVPYEDIVREGELKGIDDKKTEEVIEKLKRAGDLFSPKPGMISKI